MKKHIALVFTTTFLLAAVFPSFAQVRFGIKTGLNFANSPSSDDYDASFEAALGAPYKPQMKLAFHIGGQLEFGLGKNLGLSTGLQLSAKGTRYDFVTDAFGPFASVNVKEKPLYLQIPLALTYRKNGFFAGAGPYFAFGVGGELEVKVTVDGESGTDSQDLEFGSKEDDVYTATDFGAGLELGYEFGGFRVSGSYQHGLANVVPKDQVDTAEASGLEFKKRLNVVGFSVAYFFKARKKKQDK